MSAIVTAAVIGAALLVVAIVELRERRGIGKGQAL
jgi:hypothetical protein